MQKKTCQTKKKESEHFMVNHTVRQLKEYSSIRWHWKSNQWKKRCMDTIYQAICVLYTIVVECNALKGTIESEKNNSSSGGNQTQFTNCVWNSLALAVRFYRHTHWTMAALEKFKWCICMSVCWKPFEFGVLYSETSETHTYVHTLRAMRKPTASWTKQHRCNANESPKK